MASKIRDIMTKNVIALEIGTPIVDAAKRMRDANVGALVVQDRGAVIGLITDRDITVRAVAEGRDPRNTPVSSVCSRELSTLSPDDDVDHAIRMMRDKAIRRVPVLDADRRPVGIVSLGDLALARDRQSVLGNISAATPNR